MPGKYSHSVVLADLSSRGIINLPNDQHVAYLRSSPSPYPSSQRSRHGSNPWSQNSPIPQPRSQSAMAYSGNYNSERSRVSTPSRQVIIDKSIENNDRRFIDSGYHQSTATSNYVLAGDRVKSSTPRQFKDTTYTRSTMTPDPVASQHRSVPKESRNGTSAGRTIPVDRIPVAQFIREMPSPPDVPGRRGSASAQTKPANSKLEPAIEITSKANISVPNGKSIASTEIATSYTSRPAQYLTRQESQETRVFAPRSEAMEPNFEGFSDAEEPSRSYFEPPASMKPLIAPKSTTQLKASQHTSRLETPSPNGRPTRSSDIRTKTSQSMYTDTPESDIPDSGASPYYSGSKLDSLTSSSTISSRDAGSIGRSGKLMETKKVGNQPTNQDWRLPEIDEDGTFDADFFTQGPDDLVPQVSNDSVDSFLARPLGTVSAGRDINFDQENDVESEGDAACPPDIGRSRDDEDRGPSPYVQRKTSDYPLNGGAGSLAQTPKAKKVGFFARLRSKNKTQE